jgi:hypothetical protein
MTHVSDPIRDHLVTTVSGLPGYVVMSLGGSRQAGLADNYSDYDIHVFWRAPLAGQDQRAERLSRIADPGSVQVDIRSWGLEDWLHIDRRPVELTYFNLDDLQAHVAQAYGQGLGDEGFATALLYIIAAGQPLFDATGEIVVLRERLHAQFPEPTRDLLLTHHTPLLGTYVKHLRLAQARSDLLSVQHRRYTVQMVFFNLLFTLNRRYHPGEKRLLVHAARCPLQPADLAARWNRAACRGADDPALADDLDGLCDDLHALIAADGEHGRSAQRGSEPVTTGRDGSVIQSLHEPA